MDNPYKLPPKPSIAVLRFTSVSGDPEQEYFGDGITDDIITGLSRLSGLTVVAGHSKMDHKGQAADVRQVGRELGVRYVLEGNVRKSGSRVRVSVQLVDTDTGLQRWADRYDRDLDDVFAVQDDITHRVTVEMKVQVSHGEKARMLAGRTSKFAAWEILLRANDLVNRYIREDNLEARRCAEEALRIDPEYASAWAELGWTHWEDVYCGWAESAERSEAKALKAAHKSLELEVDYPTALSLVGRIHELKGEYDQAVDFTKRALALAPSDAECNADHAHALAFAGKADEAIHTFRRAIQLCPIFPVWYLAGLGASYYSIKELNEAINVLRDAVSLESGSAFPKIFLTSALVDSGSMEEAGELVAEILEIERNFSVARWRGCWFQDAAFRDRIVDNLLKAGLPK